MKVGDVVIVNGESGGHVFQNQRGIIIEIFAGDYSIYFDDTTIHWVDPSIIKKEVVSMKERIEALEKELAALKAQLKYEPRKGSWVVDGTGEIVEEDDYVSYVYADAGRAFDTKEKALKARDIMVKHDIILKYVIDHAPNYLPEENNMYGVYFDIRDNLWYKVCQDESPDLGAILMPEWVAEKLADDLNNNRIEGF